MSGHELDHKALESLDFALGEIAALKTFCIALIATHPDPLALQRLLSALGDRTVGRALPTLATDEMIEGIETMQDDLSRAVANQLALRATRFPTHLSHHSSGGS